MLCPHSSRERERDHEMTRFPSVGVCDNELPCYGRELCVVGALQLTLWFVPRTPVIFSRTRPTFCQLKKILPMVIGAENNALTTVCPNHNQNHNLCVTFGASGPSVTINSSGFWFGLVVVVADAGGALLSDTISSIAPRYLNVSVRRYEHWALA